MIQTILRWAFGKLLQGADIIWKESFSGDEIRSYLETSLQQHIPKLVVWQANPAMHDAFHDVQKAHQLSASLGLPSPALPMGLEAVTVQSAATCQGNFKRLLARGKVIEGAAELLEESVENCELAADFCEEMNRVIRHVEIKRQGCLPPLAGGSDEKQDLTRARVSVALITYGRRQNDLRFLNSAMKLNDWLLMRKRKSAPSPATAKLLHALMLQEVALRGMTECE